MACSMTPPVSPMMASQDDFLDFVESPTKKPRYEDSEGEVPVCFACLGEVTPQKQQTHPQSYLQLGAIERLTASKGPSSQQFDSTVISLFGHQFVTHLALEDQMETLFYLCRAQMDRMTGGSTSLSNFLALRFNIKSFFDYIKMYCVRHESSNSTSSDSFLQRLLKQIHGLMLYMGRICDLPKHVITSCASRQGNQSLLGTYHLFHLYLDVNWSIIEVLHLLTMKYPDECCTVQLLDTEGDESYDVDIFSQFTRIFLWDLILLSSPTFNKLSLNDYHRQTPFACTCVKELLILFIKLLNFRHEKRAKQSFWVNLYPLLQTIISRNSNPHPPNVLSEIDSDKFDMQPKFECADGVGFCWWLLMHYAPLFQFDQFGVPQEGKLLDPSQSNYFAMQSLIKSMLTKRLSEGQFRCYLRCCLTLSRSWGPNGDVVILLWEHFYKRLNEPFRQATLGIDGFASTNKTPSNWLEQCKQRCSGNHSKLESDSSYWLFLRILSVHLDGQMNTTWNKLKGRFYTKFHARRMQELTEVGLINFTSLFLTLALATGAEDVISKLFDLYVLVAPSDATRKTTVWKGQFAAVMLMAERQKDVGFIAENLVQNFNSVCREASTAGLEPSRYTELYTLINIYLDATQDVIESSSLLSLSEHKLIGVGIGELLKSCRENELRKLLSFCQTVLSKVRLVSQRSEDNMTSLQLRSLSDAFWRHAFGFVKSHATTETPPSQLADLAASFALQVMYSPPSIQTGMKEDFVGIFSYFGWNERVSTRVSVRFLNHLLPNQTVLECLGNDLKDFETFLIAAWFRCAWQLSSEDPQMSELTRLVMKLQKMKHVFQDAGLDPELGEEPVVHMFIQALGKQYTGITDLREKMQYQNKVNAMLGDVVKHIIFAQRPGATEELKVAYRLGGLLAKYCAPILYIKSNPRCIFPELIGRLALPRILLTPNKVISPPLLAAIRENLYLFMQGLSRLDFRRDPYIKRRIQEIVSHYLTRFPVKSSFSFSSTSHPILTSLSESSCSQPCEEFITFRHLVLSLIRDEVLNIKGGSSINSNVNVGLGFLSALLNLTESSSVIARDCDVLLPVILDLVLLGQQQATSVLQRMLEACAVVDGAEVRARVSQIVELFVSKQMAMYQGRVMKILESVSMSYPAGVVPVIPALSAAVRSSETKRGVGVDKQLRLQYFSVLNKLGEAGQAEKSSLLANSV